VVSLENIYNTDTEIFPIEFSIGWDDEDHYLVVDNMDNPHEEDALANEPITVDVIIEKDEWISWELLVVLLIGAFCVLPIAVVTGILLWIFLEPRVFPQAKSRKFLNLTRRPAFQTLPLNPHLELTTTPPPPSESQPPNYPTQVPPSQYPTQVPPSPPLQ